MGPEAVAQVLTGVERSGGSQDRIGLMRSNHGEDLPYQAIVQEGVIKDDTFWVSSEHRDIDLVVLGTHGRRGLDQLMLGSVAEKGLPAGYFVRCSRLVQTHRQVGSETAPVKHILYPMELSANVPDAAAHALNKSPRHTMPS